VLPPGNEQLLAHVAQAYLANAQLPPPATQPPALGPLPTAIALPTAPTPPPAVSVPQALPASLPLAAALAQQWQAHQQALLQGQQAPPPNPAAAIAALGAMPQGGAGFLHHLATVGLGTLMSMASQNQAQAAQQQQQLAQQRLQEQQQLMLQQQRQKQEEAAKQAAQQQQQQQQFAAQQALQAQMLQALLQRLAAEQAQAHASSAAQAAGAAAAATPRTSTSAAPAASSAGGAVAGPSDPAQAAFAGINLPFDAAGMAAGASAQDLSDLQSFLGGLETDSNAVTPLGSFSDMGALFNSSMFGPSSEALLHTFGGSPLKPHSLFPGGDPLQHHGGLGSSGAGPSGGSPPHFEQMLAAMNPPALPARSPAASGPAAAGPSMMLQGQGPQQQPGPSQHSPPGQLLPAAASGLGPFGGQQQMGSFLTNDPLDTLMPFPESGLLLAHDSQEHLGHASMAAFHPSAELTSWFRAQMGVAPESLSPLAGSGQGAANPLAPSGRSSSPGALLPAPSPGQQPGGSPGVYAGQKRKSEGDIPKDE